MHHWALKVMQEEWLKSVDPKKLERRKCLKTIPIVHLHAYDGWITADICTGSGTQVKQTTHSAIEHGICEKKIIALTIIVKVLSRVDFGRKEGYKQI